MNTTIIVIPTFNEYENVEILLEQFIQLDVDVVFIDDNSIDRTGEIIKSNLYFNKKYFLIKREMKMGYASACIEGINFGINNKYKTIVQMDADLSHSVKDLCDYVFTKLDLDYRDYVGIDEKYFRPEELDDLKGDCTKAKEVLSWEHEYTFESMLDEMIDYQKKLYMN